MGPTGPFKGENMHCPDTLKDHVIHVLKGEYSIDLKLARPVFLDIGANVGAFAVWAKHFWPHAIVHCFEPLKSNFEYLTKNTEHLTDVHLNNYAIGDTDRTKLFLGKNNCGESSFNQIGEQLTDYEIVTTKSPSILPKADVLKLDTEGCEVEILQSLQLDYEYIMLEYHSEADRRKIDELLDNYILIGSSSNRRHRGVVKYLLKN